MPTEGTEEKLKGFEMTEIYFKEESYEIIGACLNVYKEMGHGFLESVYHECLCIEFEYRKIPYISKKPIKLVYRNRELMHTFEPDFICYNKIIIEIKSVSELINEHRSQILNYLNASKYKLGYLINFGHYPELEYERFVL